MVKVHIPDETYKELNKQIYGRVTDLEERNAKVEVEADAPDALVTLIIEARVSVKVVPFVDEAWGFRRYFKENNWYCEISFVSVKVTGDDGEELDSDFDFEKIEGEYEETEWI